MSDQAEVHRMVQNEDWKERKKAANIFYFEFADLPEIDQAWEDLHRLSQDHDINVRLGAAKALGHAFPDITDKDQAWQDFIQLIQDENALVKNAAIESFGVAFPHFPDKKRAWKNLHWLMRDSRRSVAIAIGSAFPHIPDKDKALRDLARLACDMEKGVRISANYSLGRISIFKATEAQVEEIFRNELEKALGYFEESAKYTTFFSPARFSLPFYRAFHTIIFKDIDAETAVQKCLAEVKIGISDLENKQKLFEAAGELTGLLEQVREALDFEKIRSIFNTFRHYCEKAADLIDTTRQIRK